MSEGPPEGPRAARDARGAGVGLLTLLAQAAMPAFHIQLARSLGASGYGLYTTASNLADIASVLTLFGMDAVLVRQLGIALAEGDEARAVRHVSAVLRAVVLSGILAAAALGLAAPWIASAEREPGLVAPLRVLVLVPVAYHAASVFLIATQAKLALRYEFWTRGVAQPLALLALTALALRTGGGVTGACAAVAAGMAATALLAARFYGREYPLGETLARALRDPVDGRLVRLGLPLLGMNLVAALRGRVDALFLLHYQGKGAVGVYNGCVPYVATLFQVRSAFYPLIAATIPALIERRETEALNAFLRRQARWVATLAVPLFVLFAGFGDGLLAVFGRDFMRGRDALAILAVGHLVSALSVATWSLPLSGHAHYSALSSLAAVAAQLMLPHYLIPRWGLAGAAMSSTAALCISESLGLYFARRLTGAQALSPALAKVCVAGALGFAAGRGAQALAGPGVAPRFFLGVAVAALAYLVALVALGLDTEDLDLARAAWAKVRGRRA